MPTINKLMESDNKKVLNMRQSSKDQLMKIIDYLKKKFQKPESDG